MAAWNVRSDVTGNASQVLMGVEPGFRKNLEEYILI